MGEHHKVELACAVHVRPVKVACGMGNVTLELGAKQHVCIYVVGVGCLLAVVGIAHGE